MNNKIIIVISVIITIGIIAFSLTQIDESKNETPSKFEETDEIGSMLKKIEEDKIRNDESDSPYVPAKRDWPSSGPIKIDRSQYVLGEKIFISFEPFNEKGKAVMIFAKIINATHSQQYKKIDFTGSEKEKNVYFAIYPSLPRQFCTVDDIIGDWEVSFPGTNLEKIQFKVLDKMIPGMDYSFGPVC